METGEIFTHAVHVYYSDLMKTTPAVKNVSDKAKFCEAQGGTSKPEPALLLPLLAPLKLQALMFSVQ